ncbi:hypothetical protein [Teichococcus aestuarii]|uniref:hypothetical protein n=1 Tax=Teichococcus aestuarii TaxID=568898 RepID=UPI00361D6E4D
MMPYQEFVGRAETREDRIDPRLVEGLAATLSRPVPQAELPPLWHWMLFQDWKPADGLGPDGHPKRGGFLPRCTIWSAACGRAGASPSRAGCAAATMCAAPAPSSRSRARRGAAASWSSSR